MLNVDSNVYACKALDDLTKFRLIREDNELWIEKAIITRIWISTNNIHAENAIEQLQQMFDMVVQDSNSSLSAPATHAAQTLLWKKVEETSAQEQNDAAEAWCQLCLHPLLEKAGAQNKVKIMRCVVVRDFSMFTCIATDFAKENRSVCAIETGLYSCPRYILQYTRKWS